MRVIIAVLCVSMNLFAKPYVAKDFSDLKKKMPRIHAELLDIHFKLYNGYVNQCNALDVLLEKEIDKNSFTYTEIKRRFGWEYDSMVLHELYFENLGGDGKIKADSEVSRAITREFGSYEAWIKDFKATCLLRGIGWAVLYFNPITKKMRNVWIQEHSTGPLIGELPLLVVDMWEHAYLCQFGLQKIDYVNTALGYVDWDVVESRIKG